ncbi:MAG: peptidoglycan-associated lipoprotein Pal [Geobacteraceae bacterium]|nr:peptidoglycan-associated lipoprotein Pal [Geobacteraceae bacterium]
MCNRMIGVFLILCCGAFWVNGCANKEMVKKEESSITTHIEKNLAEPFINDTLPREEKQSAGSTFGIVKASSETQVLAVSEIILEKIHFDFDSYLLDYAARDTLSKNAEYLLKKNTAVKIQIEGHCDEHGSDEYNLALGEKRAQAAFNYLETLGVPSARLSVISYGKEMPLNNGHDEAVWAQNRRAEFVIIK